jgi:uncharacterized protein (TIGR02421 family)
MGELSAKDLEFLQQNDRELVTLAKDFKILTMIEWPKNIQAEFLAGYKTGQPKLPHVEYANKQFGEPLKRLENIINNTSNSKIEHPIAQFIHMTALSYFSAHRLVENLGQPDMLKHSIDIYGRPGDPVAGSKFSSLDAANFFVEISDQFNDYFNIAEEEVCILADTIKDQLERAIKEVITDDKVSVQLDENLVPKAAAGVTRVRLRSGTCFSKFDFRQLLEHEVFVHTLTALNGRYQKQLTCLSLGAPRTTATQEGLATFAELITGAIDLNRLKRIALRVIAVDMGLKGANFIEVFEYFKKNKQSDSESYSSTQRIFRGGDPKGGIVFTKDSVYLDGLLRSHSFFRWAMKSNKLNLTRVLFSGRMTFDDAERLAPYMESNLISPPKYLPPWLSQVPTLGGYLAFSLFANKIRVGGLDKEFGTGG